MFLTSLICHYKYYLIVLIFILMRVRLRRQHLGCVYYLLSIMLHPVLQQLLPRPNRFAQPAPDSVIPHYFRSTGPSLHSVVDAKEDFHYPLTILTIHSYSAIINPAHSSIFSFHFSPQL